MRRVRLTLAGSFAAALLALAPPAPAAPVPKHLMPKEEPLFFITRVGDRHVSDIGGREIVCVITKVEKTADGLVVTEEQEIDMGAPTHNQTVVVSEKGLLVTHYSGKALDPPVWLLKLPHVANNAWTDQWGNATRHLKTAGWEEIEIPAGKMRAMRVDRDDDGTGTSITTYWYAPGKGCIKWSSGNTKREWKSFTPAK